MRKIAFLIALSFFTLENRLHAQENKTLVLTENFSVQLSKIICSWPNEFAALRGEKLIQSSDLLFKSNIQLEGGKETQIKMGKIEVDFGRYTTNEERYAVFYQLKDRIQQSSIACCKLEAEPEDKNKQMMPIRYSQKWKVSNPSDPGMKELVVELMLSGSSIYLYIEIARGDYYDDDEGW